MMEETYQRTCSGSHFLVYLPEYSNTIISQNSATYNNVFCAHTHAHCQIFSAVKCMHLLSPYSVLIDSLMHVQINRTCMKVSRMSPLRYQKMMAMT